MCVQLYGSPFNNGLYISIKMSTQSQGFTKSQYSHYQETMNDHTKFLSKDCLDISVWTKGQTKRPIKRLTTAVLTHPLV